MAATRYVSDDLTVNLRRGQGNEFKILKMLKIGTPLEILSEDSQWTEVREPGGTVGFVPSQYLTADIPLELVAKRLEMENARLADELKQIKESYKDVDNLVTRFKAQISELETGRSTAEKGLAEFQGKYETLRQEASNVVKLQEERDQLALANQQLTTELTTLRSERDAVLRTGMIKWFLAGGGVLLCGWLLGRLTRKKTKRSGW